MCKPKHVMSARALKKAHADESGTRERILVAAAPLFAEHGFDATGVRAIAAIAEVNIAAVNYHFGSKDALVAAVGERHVRAVGERRFVALEAVLKSAADGKPTVEAIVEAYVAPSVRFMKEDPSNFQLMRLLLTRIKSDPENTGKLMREALAPVQQKFVDALMLALPGVSRVTLHRGMHLSVGCLLHTMNCTEVLELLIPGAPDNPEDTIRRVVSFASAGIRSLAVAETTAAR